MAAIVVLGGHCSGAGCVAGLLRLLGVNMGPNPPAMPAWHHEDGEFLDLHRKILGEVDGAGKVDPARWRYPQPQLGPHKEAYAALVGRRRASGAWGLKDPRLCYLLPHFLSFLPASYPVKFVRVCREWRQAARHLHDRERRHQPGFAWEEAMAVTAGHEEALDAALAAALRRGPALSLSYDLLAARPATVVAELASFAGRAPTDAALAAIAPEDAPWEPEPRPAAL